jgi:hypothetical protein
MILDFHNLTLYQVKLLNKISRSIILEFNQLSKEILNSSDKSIAWLVNSIVSRNAYQSDLFLNCNHLVLAKTLIDEGNIERIITSNYQIAQVLQSYVIENGLAVAIETRRDNDYLQSLRKHLIPFNDLYYNIKTGIKYSISKNTFRNYTIPRNKRITLLDTFILSSGKRNGIYSDRHYTGILNYLSKNEKEKIFFVPTIIGNINKSNIRDIYKNFDGNILYKHDYLTVKDYINSLFALLRTRIFARKEILFRGFNVYPLIKKEFKQNRFSNSAFQGLLNYRFVSNLKRQGIKLRLFIDWNENQPIDKGIIRGVRDYYPNVHIKGYQGFIISTDFNFYIQPTQIEIENGVIPDEICVVGRELEYRIRKYAQNIIVTTAPAFRFSGVYKKYPINNKTNTILIALPIGLNDSVNIITVLSESLDIYDTVNFNINIKPHPSLSIKKLIKRSGKYWKKIFKIIDGDFNNCVVNSNLLIGSTSSTLIETLTRGIPVIVISSQHGLTQNPIPETVDNRIWKLCSTPEELCLQIRHYINHSDEDRRRLNSIGKEIRDAYFEPITKNSVNKFLSKNNI